MSFHGVLDALRPINPESTPELANSVNGSTKSSSFKKPTNERERTQDQWPLVMQRLKKQNKKFKNKKKRKRRNTANDTSLSSRRCFLFLQKINPSSEKMTEQTYDAQ